MKKNNHNHPWNREFRNGYSQEDVELQQERRIIDQKEKLCRLNLIRRENIYSLKNQK